jgi:hypothetical protein
MLHFYTSLAFSLKNSDTFLRECSSEFKELVNQIKRKQFFVSNTTLQKQVCYAMKKVSTMVVNHHKMSYPVNKTMNKKLDFLPKA